MKKSEFRQDIVSGDWVLVSPGRFKYNKNLFSRNAKERKVAPLSRCPFESNTILKNVDKNIIFEYAKENKSKNWRVRVLQNKFPAVVHNSNKAPLRRIGLFNTVEGVGHHDLVITRDHTKNFPHLTKEEAFQVFVAFRDRYLMLFNDKNISYVSMFHNWGPGAGASIFHPHYQIIGIPVVPPDIEHSLEGAKKYFTKNKKCVHCSMISWERSQRKRVIYETENVIAFTPFVSRSPFEIRIFPKRHDAFFENTQDFELEEITHTLQHVLHKVEKNLGDPDYNFFIHTSPATDKKEYKFYHWHLEIYPVFKIRGGFEYETGMTINIVNPDLAAKILRK